MPVLTYIYISSVFVAALSGLISFRLDLAVHLKLFSTLLCLTFLVELAATTLAFGFHLPNHRLYNSFMLLEFEAYAWFYLQIIRVPALRKIIRWFMVIFPIFWLATVVFVFGFNAWNSYTIVAGSFFSTLFAVMYYYQIILAPEILPLKRLPEFWIATGMLIFYLVSFSFFGTLNFLIKFHPDAAVTLLNVYQFLDTIMYILFSYSFLCKILNTRKS